jgi:carbon monoxide dehydrogenase subunit G
MTLRDLVDVAHELPGRVRFRVRGRPSRSLLAAIEAELDATPGVHGVRVNEAAASIVVEYDPASQSRERLLDLPINAEAALEAPARIDESIMLHATPDQIWGLLDRFQGLPSDGGLIAVEETGPGTWRLNLTLLGQQLQLRVVRAEEVPAQRLVFHLEGALQGHCVFSLMPEDGSTRVRERVSYTLGNGIVDRTLGTLIEPILRRLAREQLASLQNALQHSPQRASPGSA